MQSCNLYLYIKESFILYILFRYLHNNFMQWLHGTSGDNTHYPTSVMYNNTTYLRHNYVIHMDTARLCATHLSRLQREDIATRPFQQDHRNNCLESRIFLQYASRQGQILSLKSCVYWDIVSKYRYTHLFYCTYTHLSTQVPI